MLRHLCRLSLLFLPFIASIQLYGQGVFYLPPTRVISTSFNAPYGVWVDPQGNVFVSDTGAHAVYELKAVNGSVPTNAAPVALAATFYGPEGITPSTFSGALSPITPGPSPGPLPYPPPGSGPFLSVTDYGATCLYIISLAANPSAQQCVGSGLSSPNSVASDPSGNLIVADYVNNAIKKIAFGSDSNSTPTTLIGNISLPNSVAIDSSGNLFYTQAGGGKIIEALAVNGAIPSNPTTHTVGSNFTHPHGLSFDATGNLFVADDGVIEELTASSGFSHTQLLAAGLDNPINIASDGQGNIYFTQGDPLGGSHSLTEILMAPQDFGMVPIGTTSQSLSLTFKFTQLLHVGGISVVSQGAPGFTFTNTGTGNCTSQYQFGPEDSCTVVVTFRPSRWGAATAAVQLLDSSNNVLATGYVKGSGVGVQTNPPSTNICCPIDVATDAAGNLYLTDGGQQTYSIRELLAGSSTIRTIFTTTDFPFAFTVDPAGDLFYTVSSWATQQTVLKEVLAPGYTQTKSYNSDVYNPTSIAVDHAGNLFFSAWRLPNGPSEIREAPASGGTLPSTLQSKVIGGAFLNTHGLAIDSAGNLFVADSGDNTVKEIAAAGGYPSSRVITSGLNDPISVSVDGSGNVFAVDDSTYLKEILAAGSYATTVNISIDQFYPQGVAADKTGNVFLAFVATSTHILEELKSVGSSTAPLTTKRHVKPSKSISSPVRGRTH